MATQGVAVNVQHVHDADPRMMAPADLYLFSSPGRMGNPIKSMRRFLKKAQLRAGTKCAILTTELLPMPDRKTGDPPGEEELGKCQLVIPKIKEILREKDLVSVCEGKIYVTGIKGPLEEGWQQKVSDFASRIPISG
jgi:hypothetical protein